MPAPLSYTHMRYITDISSNMSSEVCKPYPPPHHSRVVTAPLCHVHNDLLDGLVVVAGVDAVGGAPLLGRIKLAGVDVHGKDARRTSTLMMGKEGEQGKGGGGGSAMNLSEKVWSAPN